MVYHLTKLIQYVASQHAVFFQSADQIYALGFFVLVSDFSYSQVLLDVDDLFPLKVCNFIDVRCIFFAL